jgi:hypothetical protein
MRFSGLLRMAAGPALAAALLIPASLAAREAEEVLDPAEMSEARAIIDDAFADDRADQSDRGFGPA